jgi:predicted glycosyltransferase
MSAALILVTHLLGVGHLTRAAALARGLTRSGWRVTLISGGRPAKLIGTAGIDLVQLPPVHCRDADFRTLLAEDGAPASEAVLAARRATVLETFAAAAPDVVVAELYPFGRRRLRAEFEALFAAAAARRPRPAILVSVRDLPNPPASPARAAETLAALGRHVDAVLVHGDADLVPFEAAWPVTPDLRRRLTFTGYLHAAEAAPGGADSSEGTGEILVSGGGSAAGLPLARASVAAARLTPDLRWHVLVAHGVGDDDFAALARAASPPTVIERARPDFAALLRRCAVSVSQAGYNTVLDLAAAGARAVLVPFAEGGEQEQTLRAQALAARGLAMALPLAGLDPPALAAAVSQLAGAPRPDWSAVRRDGVARAVAAIGAEVSRRQAVTRAWDRLEAALENLAAAGRRVDLWLRDDDATAPTPALLAFLDRLAVRSIPVALAVIPQPLDPALAGALAAYPLVDVLVHGWSHVSHAAAGAKRSEYPPGRPLAEVTRELVAARKRVEALLPGRVLPVFVPPWNRIAADAAEQLPAAGFRALSTLATTRTAARTAGLPRLDTHWDPIDWHRGRGLRDEAVLIEALTRLIAEPEAPGARAQPLGLLTHHAAHDAWIDRFLEAVLMTLAASPAVRFTRIGEHVEPR